ncbi:MAG: class I SAM-dependent methyltransferase [Nanoarchaeota archaeon]
MRSKEWVLVKDGYYLARKEGVREMHIVNPPSEDVLRATYSQAYFEGTARSGYHHNVFAQKRKQIHKAQRKLQRIKRYVPAGGCILDVGCGPGFFVSEARKVGYVVEGCDISSAAGEYAQKELNLDIQVSDFLSLPFSFHSFEGITMFSVLEHALSPEENLQKAHSLLRDGGLLALSIPNAWGMTRYLKGVDWRGFSFPEHLHFWGRQEMTELLEKNGFRDVQAPLKDNNFFRDTVYYYAWKR